MENILLTQTGYIQLADFGFVKRLYNWQRTYTLCGTAEYMAPEIILNKGYCHSVDWYALGIMLYEMMYGRTPFLADNNLKIMQKACNESIKFPQNFDPEAKNLIKKLTNKDLTKRYGFTKGTMEKIKNHSFFKYTDWVGLLAKTV